MPTFDNRFCRELPADPEPRNFVRGVERAMWSAVATTPVASPRLVAHSAEMADALGLSAAELHGPHWLAALAGNGLIDGMRTWASCYGGHQFGHWAGQLGDGRAISLGELVTAAGARWELQLKGAGPTPYSRRADGRAVLRSSVREFLCSEAMHHLGIPTTRALSLVTTGEAVVRDMFYDGHPRAEPGAIVCRVAPSFTRFGQFEIHTARGHVEQTRQLADFTLARDFPHIDATDPQRYAIWFHEVARRTARMVAGWMAVGFVHGVMNTDNMSILGQTIDYGPYGWIDDFDPGWTPNTTDAEGRRYAFGNQPEIAAWNLERLAMALQPLFDSEQPLVDGLTIYDDTYAAEFTARYAAKLGFATWREEFNPLLTRLFDLLQSSAVDMTDFFRRLCDVDVDADIAAQAALLAPASYRPEGWDRQAAGWADWLRQYANDSGGDTALAGTADLPGVAARRARMRAANPRYVLRNYLAQMAIDRAEAGDFAGIGELLDVMRRPFDDQPGHEHFAALRPDWARHKPGCSMLSCSS